MPEISHPPTPDELVAALSEAGGELDGPGRRIALATYRLLAGGRPAAVPAIAAAAGAAEEAVAERLATWPGVFRDGDGAVVGFWGLALEPLEPRYELRGEGGSTLGYAWCAWDTLFLPTLLGRTVEVSASDAEGGQPVRLTVDPGGVRRVEPAGTVVSFLAPAGAWDADVMTTFCHKVLFFADGGRARRWMASRPDPLFALGVGEAFDVGARWVQDRYGDALTAPSSAETYDAATNVNGAARA